MSVDKNTKRKILLEDEKISCFANVICSNNKYD